MNVKLKCYTALNCVINKKNYEQLTCQGTHRVQIVSGQGAKSLGVLIELEIDLNALFRALQENVHAKRFTCVEDRPSSGPEGVVWEPAPWWARHNFSVS